MIIHRFIIIVFFLFTFSFSQTVYEDEIKHLLNYLSKSDCIFERNGEFYKSDKVKKHILYKKEYFKQKIKSTEDYIKYSATKSEITGKKYKVHCQDKKVQNLGIWFLEELKRYREK